MYNNLFSEQSIQDLISALPGMPTALWETFYVTVLSTALSLLIGLPLGILLVTGEKNGVLPLPAWLMHVLNAVINLLRSIPFIILMIMVLPLSRAIIGTAVGTTATIVPLVAAAFPFVARLVERHLVQDALKPEMLYGVGRNGEEAVRHAEMIDIPACKPRMPVLKRIDLAQPERFGGSVRIPAGGQHGVYLLETAFPAVKEKDVVRICLCPQVALNAGDEILEMVGGQEILAGYAAECSETVAVKTGQAVPRRNPQEVVG